MLLFSPEHSEEGQRLQKMLLDFEKKFKGIVEEVWTEDEDRSKESDEKDKPSKPTKPVFGSQPWMIRFWLD